MIQNIHQIIRFSQLPMLLLVFYFAYCKWWFWKDNSRYFIWFILALICYFVVVLFLKYVFYSKYLDGIFNHLFFPTDFILVGLFLSGFINNGKPFIFTIFLNIFIICYALYNTIWAINNKPVYEVGLILQNIYLITLSLMAFRKLFNENAGENIIKKPNFWLILGILLSYITYFLFSFSIIILASRGFEKYNSAILIFVDLVNIFYLFLYIKGISLIPKQSPN